MLLIIVLQIINFRNLFIFDFGGQMRHVLSLMAQLTDTIVSTGLRITQE